MTKLEPPLAIALATLVCIAAAWDIQTRRIPNPLVLAGAAAGLLLNIRIHGWMGVKSSLLGLLVGLAVFLPPFLLQGKGGGDVKLMAAIGSMAGPANALVIFILVAISGGLMAVALLLWKGGLMRALRNVAFILSELAHGRAPHEKRPDLTLDSDQAVKLPYGVAIAAGSLFFLLL
jgi:prepilin peptidase CpaA